MEFEPVVVGDSYVEFHSNSSLQSAVSEEKESGVEPPHCSKSGFRIQGLLHWGKGLGIIDQVTKGGTQIGRGLANGLIGCREGASVRERAAYKITGIATTEQTSEIALD